MKLRFKSDSAPGFTLLELLISMAILTILIGVAAPSLREQYASWMVKARAQQLLAAVMAARSDAVRHSHPVTLCPWPDAIADALNADVSSCAGSYSDGFAVVSDEGGLLRYTQAHDRLLVLNRAGSAPVTAAITWSPRGIGNRNLTFSVCYEGSDENWSLVLNRVGRPRLVKDWGSCPTS